MDIHYPTQLHRTEGFKRRLSRTEAILINLLGHIKIINLILIGRWLTIRSLHDGYKDLIAVRGV